MAVPGGSGERGSGDAVQRQQQAYAELKHRIMHGALPPGTQMLESDVAGLLGMSRTPVREAMIRLAEEGLIEVRPRHGMRVLGITVDDLEEIYAVRTPLEAAAVRMAAARGLSDRELDELSQSLERMERALAEDHLSDWALEDGEFHRLLVNASRNRRLISIIETLRGQLHRGTMATCEMREKPSLSNIEHRAVFEAIADRQPDLAERRLAGHLHRSGGMLIELLRTRGLTSI